MAFVIGTPVSGNADTTPLKVELPEHSNPAKQCQLFIRSSAGVVEVVTDSNATAGLPIPAVTAGGEAYPAGTYRCAQDVYLYASSSTAVEYVTVIIE